MEPTNDGRTFIIQEGVVWPPLLACKEPINLVVAVNNGTEPVEWIAKKRWAEPQSLKTFLYH